MGFQSDTASAAPPSAGGRLSAALAAARRAWRAVASSERAWSGAIWGLCAATVVTWAAKVMIPFDGWPSIVAGLLGIAWGAAGGLALLLAVGLLAALPSRFRLVLSASLFLLWFYVLTGGVVERARPTIHLVMASAVAGAAIAAYPRSGSVRASRRGRVAASVAFAASIVAGGLGLAWLLGPGEEDPPAIDAAAATHAPVAELALPDPSMPGTHRVQRLFYGSGTSTRRPEYGPGVELRTRPVDGRRMLPGWRGLDGWARARYWGFDARALPLNARVILPEGPGPFPVVIAVHGGHAMSEPSEAGYDYLGEHLASHGYAFVAVDESFLNAGAWADLGGNLAGENAARGWLLLEHLRALRGFHEAEGPLHGKLDLDRVALVGHSKGGEAITLAALFNRLPSFPDDATVRFDYGFGIRALVALATTDKQYRAGGAETVLEGVDFLALQGSNDGDVEQFQGMAQYERVKVGGPAYHLKAAVYVHRANHGQWNRVWGRYDKSRLPRRLFFNRRPVLPEDQQERVAKAYLTAFFSVSLRGDTGYLPFLQDYRAGRRWLPDTIYLTRFEDSASKYVARFDEDVDVTTTTLPGGRIHAEGLTAWREQPAGPALFWGGVEGRAAYIGWNPGERSAARYAIDLPPGLDAHDLAPGSSLVFDLADAQDPSARRGAGRASGPRPPIDLSVEIADRAGHVARISLADVRLLQPRLETNVWKSGLQMELRRESVLSTFAIPLSRFVEQAPELRLADLQAICFVFDRTPEGAILLDDVGFARGR